MSDEDDGYVRCYKHNHGGYRPCLACENERLRDLFGDLATALREENTGGDLWRIVSMTVDAALGEKP